MSTRKVIRKILVEDINSDESWEWEVDEEPIAAWVQRLGGRLTDTAELRGIEVPVFQVDASPDAVVDSIPDEWEGLSGSYVQLRTPQGDVLVFLEDWLSGCLPGGFREEGFDYGDPIVDEYCLNAMIKKREKIAEEVGPQWHLILDTPYEESGDGYVTRFAWIQRRAA